MNVKKYIVAILVLNTVIKLNVAAQEMSKVFSLQNDFQIGRVTEYKLDTYVNRKAPVYLVEEAWLKTFFVSTDSIEIGPIDAKYDLNNNLFIIKPSGNQLQMDGNAIDRFTYVYLGDTINFSHTNNFSKANLSGFLQVLVNNNVSLLKHYKVSYKEPNYIPELDSGEKKGTFLKSSFYYILRDGEIDRISANKKDVLKKFSNYEQSLKTYMKENKLVLKNEQHLIEVVKKVNSLRNSE